MTDQFLNVIFYLAFSYFSMSFSPLSREDGFNMTYLIWFCMFSVHDANHVTWNTPSNRTATFHLGLKLFLPYCRDELLSTCALLEVQATLNLCYNLWWLPQAVRVFSSFPAWDVLRDHERDLNQMFLKQKKTETISFSFTWRLNSEVPYFFLVAVYYANAIFFGNGIVLFLLGFLFFFRS